MFKKTFNILTYLNKLTKMLSSISLILIMMISPIGIICLTVHNICNNSSTNTQLLPKSADTNSSPYMNTIEYWKEENIGANNLQFEFPDLSAYGVYEQQGITMPNKVQAYDNTTKILLANGSRAVITESLATFDVTQDFYTILSSDELAPKETQNELIYVGLAQGNLFTNEPSTYYIDSWNSMYDYNYLTSHSLAYKQGYSDNLTYTVGCTDLTPTTLIYGDTGITANNIGFLSNITDVKLVSQPVVTPNIGVGSNSLNLTNAASNVYSNDTTEFQTPCVYGANQGASRNTTDYIHNTLGFQNVKTPVSTTDGYVPMQYSYAELDDNYGNYGFDNFASQINSGLNGQSGKAVPPSINQKTYNALTGIGHFDFSLIPTVNLVVQTFDVGMQYIVLDGDGNLNAGWASYAQCSGVGTLPSVQRCEGFTISNTDIRMQFQVTANIYSITTLNSILSNDTLGFPTPYFFNTTWDNNMGQGYGSFNVSNWWDSLLPNLGDLFGNINWGLILDCIIVGIAVILAITIVPKFIPQRTKVVNDSKPTRSENKKSESMRNTYRQPTKRTYKKSTERRRTNF